MKNEVTKKTEYNGLVKKVANINITDTSDLVRKTDSNTKINEIEIEIMVMLNILLLKNSRS